MFRKAPRTNPTEKVCFSLTPRNGLVDKVTIATQRVSGFIGLLCFKTRLVWQKIITPNACKAHRLCWKITNKEIGMMLIDSFGRIKNMFYLRCYHCAHQTDGLGQEFQSQSHTRKSSSGPDKQFLIASPQTFLVLWIRSKPSEIRYQHPPPFWNTNETCPHKYFTDTRRLFFSSKSLLQILPYSLGVNSPTSSRVCIVFTVS